MQIESVARAIDRLNRFLQFCDKLLRLLSTKYGTSRKKNVLRAHLKRNHGKLYINVKLIKYRL